MTRGIGGYGRYNDDPSHVGCPRAQSDMTPCIARDGRLALAGEGHGPFSCVGCDSKPHTLLKELSDEGVEISLPTNVHVAADALQTAVREATKGLTP